MHALRDQLLQHRLAAAPPEARFGHLRAHLTQAPSPEAWDALVACIDTWPAGDPARAVALDYAQAHLDAAWPDALRVAPPAWWSALDADPHDPRWPLVRSLHVRSLASSVLARLDAHAAPLRHLTVEGACAEHLVTDAHLAALTHLHALTLDGADLDPDLLAHLLARLGPSLRALTLRRCALAHASIPDLLRLPERIALRLAPAPPPPALASPHAPLTPSLAALVCLARDLDAGRLTALAVEHDDPSDAAAALWAQALHSPGLARVTHARLARLSTATAYRSLAALAAVEAPALAHLDLTGCDLSSAALGLIGAAPWAPQLTSLTLDDNPIGAEGLRALAAAPLPLLKRLSLQSCALDADALAAFADAPLLARLDALDLKRNRCEPSDALLRFLQSPRLRGLKRLALCDLREPPRDDAPSPLQALARAPVVDTLDALDLANSDADLPGLVALAARGRARPALDLSVSAAQRRATGFGAVWAAARQPRAVLDWSSLQEMPAQARRRWHLGGPPAGPDPDALARWAHEDIWAGVDTLNLAHTAVNADLARALATSPTLAQHPPRALLLPDTYLTADALQLLTRALWWPRLDTLDLSRNAHLGDALNSALAAGRLDHIRRLNVDHTRLNDRAVARWRRRPSRALRRLSARGNRLSCDGLGALLGLPALASLDVGFNPLHTGPLKPPRRRPDALASLGLRGARLPADALGRLIDSGRLDALRALDLGVNQLAGASAGALLRRASWPHLAALRLDRNPLGARGLAAALDALESAPMAALDLGRAELTAPALDALTRQPFAPALDALALSGNPLGRGLGARLGAVSWARLRALLLDHVPLGAAGLLDLLHNTDVLDALDALSLSAADLDDRALARLLQAPCYAGLVALFLALNPLGGDGLDAFLSAPPPVALAALDLRGVPLRSAQRRTLRQWRDARGVRVHMGALRGCAPEGRALGLRDQIWRAALATAPDRPGARDAAPWRALTPSQTGRWFVYYDYDDDEDAL